MALPKTSCLTNPPATPERPERPNQWAPQAKGKRVKRRPRRIGRKTPRRDCFDTFALNLDGDTALSDHDEGSGVGWRWTPSDGLMLLRILFCPYGRYVSPSPALSDIGN